MSVPERVCTLVEIDIPRCTRVYGTAPCTAALGVTGDIKCFNSIRTCQDRENYLAEDETVRFAVPNPDLPQTFDARPLISGQPTYTPATISLGKDLGVRANLAVNFKDAPDPDTGPAGDRYLADRDYVPYEQGTFFGKFRARFPFIRGRPVRLIRGEIGQAIEDMRTYHFVGESFDGPRPDGSFSIVAKDLLKLLDDDRALAPAPSNGYLLAGITDADVIVELPPGIAALEYPDEGYVCIGGNEVCAFSRGAGGNDANTILLLHFDGADGATSTAAIIDSSPNALVPSNMINAELDNAHPAFGATALHSLGTGSVIYADNALFNLGTSQFTFDCRVYVSSLASARMLVAIGNNEANNNNALRWFITTGGELTLTVTSGGSTLLNFISSGAGITINTPLHLAVVRAASNVFTFYVNGVAVGTTTTAVTVPNYTGHLRIMIANDALSSPFAGWIDEFRFSNVARWTAPFTPPTGPYNSATVDDLQLLERGAFNTTARAHNAEERVQLCLVYDGLEPDLIIADLETNYAGVDASMIDAAAWAAEVDAFLQRVYSTIITEPTGVNKLVSELIEQAALMHWYDPEAAQLRLQVLRNITPDAAPIDDNLYLKGSLSTKEQPETRLSQVWTYYARRNPTLPLTDQYNYGSVVVTPDLEAETDNGSSAVKKVFSRWIPEFGRATASRVNDLMLGRFRMPPRKVTFELMRGTEPESMAPGGGFYLQAPSLQDATGARDLVPIQVTRVRPDDTKVIVEAEEATFAQLDPVDLVNRQIIIDANAYNINIRDIHDNIFPEIVDPYGISLTVIIQPGVTVGSLDVNSPALDVGSFPLGLAITILVLGRIQGKGGRGALTDQSGTVSTTAENGGAAIYTRQAITLDLNGDGEVWGGAGGGGSYYINIFYPTSPYAGGNYVYRGAGGGGAGKNPGAGGTTNQKLGGAPGVDSSSDAGTPDAGGEAHAAFSSYRAGDGGDPGQNGQAQTGASPGPGIVINAPGVAGAAIDGDSYVTVAVAGDIRGPQIN